MAPRRNPRPRPLALAYVRVSTTDQADHGASLAAQRAALTAEADARGWDVEVIADEGASGKDMRRPGLQAALERLDKGQADYLLATRLDRVSRSVADFAGLVDQSVRRGWQLRMLSPNLDTSDPAGRFTANVLSAAAQYERELISARTREGMAQRKAEGQRFGRARMVSDDTVDQIHQMRADGVSMGRIADTLTARGVPTASGGQRWYSSTVWRILNPATDPGAEVGEAAEVV